MENLTDQQLLESITDELRAMKHTDPERHRANLDELLNIYFEQTQDKEKSTPFADQFETAYNSIKAIEDEHPDVSRELYIRLAAAVNQSIGKILQNMSSGDVQLSEN
jgi:hypothetical protein